MIFFENFNFVRTITFDDNVINRFDVFENVCHERNDSFYDFRDQILDAYHNHGEYDVFSMFEMEKKSSLTMCPYEYNSFHSNSNDDFFIIKDYDDEQKFMMENYNDK